MREQACNDEDDCLSSATSPATACKIARCGDSVIDKTKIKDLPIASPACTALDANGHCPRATFSAITINMSYDATSTIFLPYSTTGQTSIFGPASGGSDTIPSQTSSGEI